MLTLEQATEKAQIRVQEAAATLGKELSLQRDERYDNERGWAFAFNTVAFWKSGHPKDGLVGNGPIFVDKHTGAVFNVPTGGKLAWLEEYNRTGVPPTGPVQSKLAP